MRKDKRGIFLGLGSNIGDLKANLKKAIELLSEEVNILKVSSFIESEPWGNEKLNSFLNAAIEINTELDPHDLLKVVKAIELKMGRKPSNKGLYENRIIDIDILLFNDEVIKSTKLLIPHPFLTKRDFVLRPLLELNKNLIHPEYKQQLVSYL